MIFTRSGPRLETTAVRQRVCVISEDLSGAPDEGIKKFAVALGTAFREHNDVSFISTRGAEATTLPDVRLVRTPRTFVGRQLRHELRRLQPHVVLYVPTASTTLMAFLRARVLKSWWPKAVVVLVGLQPRRHSPAQQLVIRHLVPDQVWVQTVETKRYLEGLGCTVGLVPSGVDLDTFRPVGTAERLALRERYGLRSDMPVVLHVGHLVASRGIGVLGALAKRGTCQVVLVASSSTSPNHHLAGELRADGVRVISTYQPHVEHFYQLADCYVFVVPPAHASAIDIPLSVLEALACEVPVVTTRFGGLAELFGPDGSPELMFVDSANELVSQTERVCASPGALGADRAIVLPYAWNAIAASLLKCLLEANTGARR